VEQIFELRHLRYFITAAAAENMTHAAAQLFMTQPALSRQIKALENILGVELFTRTPAGLKLTEAGAAFLPQARRLLEQSAEAALSMRRFVECRNSSIAIGYIAPALPLFLQSALEKLAIQYPQTETKLFELSPGNQIEALREGRLDIALIGYGAAEVKEEFKVTALRRIPLVIALPAAHPLAKKAGISLQQLKKEIFIGLDQAAFPGRNDVIEATCREAGFAPRIEQRADGLVTMMLLVSRAAGIAIMPEGTEQLPHSGVVIKPLKSPQCYIEFCAALRRNEKRREMNAIVKLFKNVASM
jgi:DNA-binding transcriptional LysR family regulator